jgi:opacity protein-like surface antigen
MPVLAILPLFAFSLALAGDESRIGTTGAEQLNIPVGARGIATSGAFIASFTGVEALYWNPAGLDRSARSEAMVSYMSYIADINMTYIALSAKLGGLGSFAFSVKTLNVGDISETSVQNPDGLGSTFSPSFVTAGLSYSKMITDRVSGGTTIKLIHEGIKDTGASGFAIDIGTQYHFANNMTIGVALKNIGANMKFTGGDLEQRSPVSGSDPTANDGFFTAVTEKFSIPSTFELGVAYKYALSDNNSLNFGGTFMNANESSNSLRFGAEYNFNNLVFLRGGYDFTMEQSGGRSDESIYGFTAGAGIDYDIGGVNLQIDYAYREVEFFDGNQVFSVKFGLGSGK